MTPAAPNYLALSLAKLREFEGSVPWMYRDTAGLVTVGIGNMLPNVSAALKLPFRVQSSGDLAGETAVRADFARVESMMCGHTVDYYREYESLVLQDADITELLRQRVKGFEAQLRGLFFAYDQFPEWAKCGLIDMIYNLGLAGLEKFTHFCVSVRARDWRTAAAQCARNTSDPAFNVRNAWTRTAFLNAANGVPLAV